MRVAKVMSTTCVLTAQTSCRSKVRSRTIRPVWLTIDKALARHLRERRAVSRWCAGAGKQEKNPHVQLGKPTVFINRKQGTGKPIIGFPEITKRMAPPTLEETARNPIMSS
jgi:hypothetical protein